MSPGQRSALLALLVAHLLFGAAQIAMLPPWEGFDETGHYSSIQQVADTGTVPRLPAARMSQTVVDYAAVAPMPYESSPPFDRQDRWTYQRFFAASAAEIAAGRRAVHNRPRDARQFIASSSENYIAQHPPLFAWMLAPVARMTSGMSLGGQLIVLRICAYTLAWLALVTGVRVAAQFTPEPSRIAVWAAAAWPIFMPSWYPSMARIGNDSLAALIVAALWAWIVTRGTDTVASAMVVGALLGAGALTKAFFIPIAAGTFGWLAFRSVTESTERGRAMVRIAMSAALSGIIAGWWYVGPSAVAVAGSEARQLAALGGLPAALTARFSMSGWFEGLFTFLGMAAWSSTWSLVRPPHIFFIPLVVVLCAGMAAYVAALRQHRPGSIQWLPLWWLVPVLAGFAYHILVHVALTGSGRGVGGYYLHILVAPLSFALGIGVAATWHRRSTRALTAIHLAYVMAFVLVVSCAQLLLFAGYLMKDGAKQYARAAVLPPWFGVPDALERLSVLAFPHTAGLLALSGMAALAYAASAYARHPVLPPVERRS